MGSLMWFFPLMDTLPCPAPGTRPSGCGTPLPSASTRSRRMVTKTGSPASGSLPTTRTQIIVSAGWDKYVKVWNLANCRLKTNHIGHTGYLNTVTMSPDGSLCASGGKDAKAMLWDLNDGKHLYTLDHADTINSLCFSPNRYWLCAATGPAIKIWDLESKNQVEELKPEVAGNGDTPQCLSMAWSADGQTLFAGYSDNQIRVWQVSISTR